MREESKSTTTLTDSDGQGFGNPWRVTGMGVRVWVVILEPTDLPNNTRKSPDRLHTQLAQRRRTFIDHPTHLNNLGLDYDNPRHSSQY